MKAGEGSASYPVCSMCYFQPRHPLVDAKGIRSFCFRGFTPRSHETHRGFHSKQGLGCNRKKKKGSIIDTQEVHPEISQNYAKHRSGVLC